MVPYKWQREHLVRETEPEEELPILIQLVVSP